MTITCAKGVIIIFIPHHDLHNHTVHCDHTEGDATVANIVRQAKGQHLDYLGISEHVRTTDELDWIRMIKDDIAALEPEMRSGLPRILVGAEMDPDPIKMDGTFIVDKPDLDYVILSIHMVPGVGIGVWRFPELNYDKSQRRRLGRTWLDWLETCIEGSDFDILGHPLRFPIELDLLDLREDGTLDEAFRVLRKLALRDSAFEINNAFASTLLRNDLIEPYAALVHELKDAGVKFSRGSDSHTSRNVGQWEFGELLTGRAGLIKDDWLDPSVF